jgi:hypothetical protein
MRRFLAACLHVALGLAAGNGVPAQELNGVHRPQPKVIVFQPAAEQTTLVGVMGQVGAPNTYEFSGPPTLHTLLTTAQGVTPAAAPLIRIVRGQRVAQSVAYPAGAHERLQSGDLVIVDRHPQRPESPPVDPAQDGVQLALLGVTEGRPYVVKVLRERAHPSRILEMLGQQPQAGYRVLLPPGAPVNPAAHLPEGTALVFDSARIDAAELPDNLPKIVPCAGALPPAQEQADIVGYGLHRTYEPPPPQPVSPPRDNALIPLPPAEDNPPLPTMVPSPSERGAATLSETAGPGRNSAPISTLPFTGTAVIPARPSQFTETAPPATSSAADAREPAWNQRVASTAVPDVNDLDAEEEFEATSSAFSIWQMLSILSSAALIVGLALALRASQQKSARQNHRSSGSERRAVVAQRAAAEVRAPIPTPHIPLQSFSPPSPAGRGAGSERVIADAAERSIVPSRRRDAAATESLEQRQLGFAQLIHHELPLIEEPLALRPGIQLALPSSAADKTSEVSTPKQFIDSPHARQLAGPHRRGAEAPVERALRQLQGDPS